MKPGEAARLKLVLARARYESAAVTSRLYTRAAYGGSTAHAYRLKDSVRLEFRQADAELTQAIEEMEALP